MGNIQLVLIQAIVVGFLAGIFSFILGGVFHNDFNSYDDSSLMIASSILTACASSLLMSCLMSLIIILSGFMSIDPDNIATPLAASIGDLVTLFFLAIFSQFLFSHYPFPLSSIAIIVILLALPLLIKQANRNTHVQSLLRRGWIPILASVVISR